MVVPALVCWSIAEAVRADEVVTGSAEGGAASAETSARDGIAPLPPLEAVGPDGRRVELPTPPTEIAQLIRRGQVSFTLYDPQRDPQEFTGLTRFDLQYRYRATSRWTVRRVGGRRQLQIRPRLQQLELDLRHEVLVPEHVMADRFFDSPLVRHELDHVRVSTDPRLKAMFERWIHEDVRQLNVPLEWSQQATDQLVREQVEEAIGKVFQRLIDMVRIRYDQLDRETDHGQRALPAGFFERVQPLSASPSESLSGESPHPAPPVR